MTGRQSEHEQDPLHGGAGHLVRGPHAVHHHHQLLWGKFYSTNIHLDKLATTKVCHQFVLLLYECIHLLSWEQETPVGNNVDKQNM